MKPILTYIIEEPIFIGKSIFAAISKTQIQQVLDCRDVDYRYPCNNGNDKRFQIPSLPGFLLIIPPNTTISIIKDWKYFLINGNIFWTLSPQ